jgi:hypothetical protein
MKQNIKTWAEDQLFINDLPKIITNNNTEMWSAPLLKECFKSEDKCFFGKIIQCHLKDKDESKNELVQGLTSLGGRLIKYFIQEGQRTNYTWIWESTYLQVNFYRSSTTVEMYSTDNEFIDKITQIVDKFNKKQSITGHVFTMIAQSGRLALHSIGVGDIPLIADNYSAKVISDYKYAVHDLNTESPSGRIILLSGEPGTGKTHLIRAMLGEVENAMFVMVPPGMIKSLSGPEFLPVIISTKGMYEDIGAIILILEDADDAITKRMADNISSTQAILNLSDGILGSMLDLRIVATTNAKKPDIDPAITRAGRMSKHIDVGLLDAERASKVMKNLLPGNEKAIFDKRLLAKISLANVYAIARENGWKPSN